MNLSRIKRNWFFFFSLFILFSSSCTKIITAEIGSGLIPPADGIITKDTFITVYAKNAGDSVIYPGINDDHVIGYVNDPLFGKTTAQINFQVAPSYFPYSFPVGGDSLFLDSIVMELHYDGVWGDSTQPLALHMYQLSDDQPFTIDSLYSTGTFFENDGELTYNNAPVPVNLIGLQNDSFHAFQDSGLSTIRIRLNNQIGQEFLNTFSQYSAYQSDSVLNIYFRGFQLSPDATGNSLARINLTNAGTKLAIYFRYLNPDSAGVYDTTVRFFNPVSGTTAHSNYITRNSAGSQFASYYPSSNSEDSLLFLEANPGNFVNIMIPGITGFQNVLIHRAELLMEQDPDPSDQYFTPPVLMLAGYSTDSARRIALYTDLIDNSGSVSLAGFGSIPIPHYNSTTETNNYSYSFNISRYVQGIITKNDSNYSHLALYAPFYTESLYSAETATLPFSISSVVLNYPASGRIRLGGGNSILHKMQLHIVYSLLPQ